MPTLYTENSEKWRALAEIDYFTQFVKAWIPFNAWYRNYYPSLKRDRHAIDEIKSNPNSFRDRLDSLLVDQGNEGTNFRSHVAQLHLELNRKYIRNSGELITFEKIVVENNPITTSTFPRNRCTYKAERAIPGKQEREINVTVASRNGVFIFSHTQPNGFNWTEIETHTHFARLSISQKRNLEECYKAIDPYKPVNLLSRDPDNFIAMANIHFINNTDLLCKGIIEILYKLRNVLFHGEIIPDKDTNKVYEPAYHVLYMLIQTL